MIDKYKEEKAERYLILLQESQIQKVISKKKKGRRPFFRAEVEQDYRYNAYRAVSRKRRRKLGRKQR